MRVTCSVNVIFFSRTAPFCAAYFLVIAECHQPYTNCLATLRNFSLSTLSPIRACEGVKNKNLERKVANQLVGPSSLPA